jgi:hypothetical protein
VNKLYGTKNERNRQILVREQNHAQRNKFCGIAEQMNKGNVGFFVRNSPTSEADQNFDQFITPLRPKHCTKSWKSPPNLKKAGAPVREPKSVREQNHAHRNNTNGPVKKRPMKKFLQRNGWLVARQGGGPERATYGLFRWRIAVMGRPNLAAARSPTNASQFPVRSNSRTEAR